MYRMTQNVAMKGNTIEITHSIAQDTDNEQKRIEEAVKKILQAYYSIHAVAEAATRN